jgi:biotin transport system substrate-specific component
MKLTTQEIVTAGLFTAIACVLTILVRVLQPLTGPVPFSLTPLVGMVAACVLPPSAAFLSMLAYVLMGLIGIPVFSAPPYGGPAYVLIPTFGFLVGFAVAAWVQSKLIRRIALGNFIYSGLAGVVVYYIIGLPYLYGILNFYLGNSYDLLAILKIGFLPFFVFDIIKVVVASFLALEICRRLNINRRGTLPA